MSTQEINGTWGSALGLLVSGANPVEFLQGYLTSDLSRLAESVSVPMSLCNLKGRVIVSGWIYQTGPDQVELIVHRSLTERLLEVLAPYARFSRCHLEVNPNSPNVSLHNDTSNAPGLIPELTFSDYQGAADCSSTIERWLMEQKFAWISVENTERFLPQALDLHNHGAVDFDKGCYLGQEIVARAQFRGAVKKELVEFTWTNDAPVVGAQNDSGDTVIAVTTFENDENNGHGLAVT